jgi:hypothetical protein
VAHTACPDCNTSIPIPVTAHTTGRADDGTLQVDVLADKTEVWAHSLTCNGTLT